MSSYCSANSLRRQLVSRDFIVKLSLIFADLSSFLVAFIVSYQLMRLWSPDFNRPLLQILATEREQFRGLCYLLLVMAGLFWLWYNFRYYTYRKPFWSELKHSLQTLAALAVFDLALMALSKWDFSRFHWFLLWSSSMVLLPSIRYLVKYGLERLGLWRWQSVIIGCGTNARDAYLALNSERLMGFDVVGFVASDPSCDISPVAELPLLPDHIETLLLQHPGMQFFLALEYEQREQRDYWLRTLAQHRVRNVAVIPTLRGVPLYGADISHFFSHEVLMLRVRNNLERFSARVLKRLFDLLAASSLLLLLSPVFAYIGWKVSRDGGSPFYGHVRVGQNGRRFKCYKFRSMILNSQAVLQKLLDTDPAARAEWDKDFKLKNDPRITPIGHFIRKTSLDELPQLWNVLKGDMSLVGPRPVVEAELERYAEDVDYYLMAKPGITGLWQVSGRNDIDYSTRVYLDSWYVKNWSLWYDIAILFKTVGVVFRREGAY